jgi:3-hydroxyisobutyrate dehydrogenase-like beta-hydroxyacid dehydrogenase
MDTPLFTVEIIMTLKLLAIGGLGTMLSPSARHLQQTPAAKYLRVLDRGSRDAVKESRRQAWIAHGAELVSSLEDLTGDGNFDGIVICAGKNGDDVEIFQKLISLLTITSLQREYFILHFSTVSCDFVQATYEYCHRHHVRYANYPLTGGSKGAETAKMLILASGDKVIYEKTKPMLEKIGVPQYFNEEIAYAAAVKLIGHVMVFHGLLGISLAAVLHKKITNLPHLESSQAPFFDFLNNGAGGTRQWEVALKHSLLTDDWQSGFSTQYALIDLLYTIKLLQDKQTPLMLTLPLLEIALLFIYLLRHSAEKNPATQSIAPLIADTSPKEIDNFLKKYLSLDIEACLQQCIDLLPPELKKILLLEVCYPTQPSTRP